MSEQVQQQDLSKRVQSIEVGFLILKAFAEKKGPMTLHELAEATKLFKSQLYRYLNSFVLMGVLVRDDSENSRWHLGPELVVLGNAALDSLDITRQAISYMRELRDSLNETVALSIWRERGPFFIHRERSYRPVNIGLDIGSYVPLYTATGKIFRAFLPADVTDPVYQQEIAEGSIKPGEYDAEVEQIKERKLAVTQASFLSGIASISTPIFSSSNKLAGALSIIGVAGELETGMEFAPVQKLLDTARNISRRLGAEL